VVTQLPTNSSLMVVLIDDSSRIARCSAAESISLALRRAVQIVCRNFRIPYDLTLTGLNCRDLASCWKGVVPEILSRVPKGKEVWVVASALKSCSRLFDRRCETCDAVSSREAVDSWLLSIADRETMGSAMGLSSDDLLSYLSARFRVLVDGWGKRLKNSRKMEIDPTGGSDVYFPDQQGCFERSRRCGGTMSVCACCPSRASANHLRVACAKTKGKCRVVTVQPAFVKRTLRPVHTALYDHISSFGWCVRGEVTKEDFLAVSSDRSDGEDFISGDYSSATDKIFLPAVEAMVRVLLEESALTAEEARVLRDSFENLQVFTGPPCSLEFAGKVHRGQMMGNLVSFPLLCLLNKVCFDLACDLTYGPQSNRVGRFNGDDCLFAGDQRFYNTWCRVTGAFGFVVNSSKTGRSTRFGELNSCRFDYLRGKFSRKISLSFLRPVERSCPGDILSGIIQGIRGLREDVQLWIVCSLMRFEICLRRISLSSLSRKWSSLLLRRRWFRDALHREPPPVVEEGDDRSLPVSLGPLPDPRLYKEITSLARRLASDHVSKWTGVPARGHSVRFLRGQPIVQLPRSPFHTVLIRRWEFLWPSRLLEIALRNPHWLLPESFSRRTWVEDHRFLVSRCEAVTGGLRHLKKSFNRLSDPLVSGIPMGGVIYCER
jgi:hypothetical protein